MMTNGQFKYIVRLFGVLIRAILWKNDPGGSLASKLRAIEDEIDIAIPDELAYKQILKQD